MCSGMRSAIGWDLYSDEICMSTIPVLGWLVVVG